MRHRGTKRERETSRQTEGGRGETEREKHTQTDRQKEAEGERFIRTERDRDKEMWVRGWADVTRIKARQWNLAMLLFLATNVVWPTLNVDLWTHPAEVSVRVVAGWIITVSMLLVHTAAHHQALVAIGTCQVQGQCAPPRGRAAICVGSWSALICLLKHKFVEASFLLFLNKHLITPLY